MFPINTDSKASLIERAASRVEKIEREKKKWKGELTHGNMQISKYRCNA